MNINLGGITKTLMDKADWIAFLYSAYSRLGGDIGLMIDYYTGRKPYNALHELTKTISNLDLLKHKLWDSPHAYTGIFKLATYARIGAEFGIVPAKYKKLSEKVMWGSGLAAATLIGSHGSPEPRSRGYGGSSAGRVRGG